MSPAPARRGRRVVSIRVGSLVRRSRPSQTRRSRGVLERSHHQSNPPDPRRDAGRVLGDPGELARREKRFDASIIHTHSFPMSELPTALRYAREQIEDAIKVVVRNERAAAASGLAAA